MINVTVEATHSDAMWRYIMIYVIMDCNTGTVFNGDSDLDRDTLQKNLHNNSMIFSTIFIA